MNDRWINAHRSWRSTSAYLLAGEDAMLFRAPLWFTSFHSFIRFSDDFDVRFADRKLARPGSGSTGFDFVHPIEKLVYRHLIATRGLRRELHCRCCSFERPSVSRGSTKANTGPPLRP